MDFEGVGGCNLRNLARQNLLLGKNGCGKSRLLRLVEQNLRGRPGVGSVRYLSPERSGLLQYEAGIEQTLTTNASWLADTRRKNQADQFRQQSAAQFRRLELLTLREIEQTPALRADPEVTFDRTVARVNGLLDRVYLTRGDPGFQINDRTTKATVGAGEISSGESELISLGIECLVFERDAVRGKINLLLIDEPDVHLHPDLQARFSRFVGELVSAGEVSVLIATHSTALLGAMSQDGDTHHAFMRYGDTEVVFSPATEARRKVIPVFGAHPLSNVFNQAPILLVEGEDDERIWQQAVRSSRGRISVYPCAVDGLAQLKEFEQEVSRIISAVYDDATAYSLRDRDLDPTEIVDLGPVKRMRLECRAAENLLLSDEVLASLGVVWSDLQAGIEAWLARGEKHPHYAAMRSFAESAFDRVNADLKEIRNDLVALMGSNKPWEVLVGQALAGLQAPQGEPATTSLAGLVGPLVSAQILKLPAAPAA